MNKKKKIILSSILSSLGAAFVVATVVSSLVFEPILTLAFGTIGGDSGGEQKSYSKFQTDEEVTAARKDISSRIEEEGAVLLRNENHALPLQAGNKISVFGQHAHEILASGSGSGSIGDPEKSLKEVLEEEGFQVNGTLWDFYLHNQVPSLGNGPALAGGNSKTDWSINECPLEKYTQEVLDSYAEYSDAAVVVISRTGGEGGDLARDRSPYGGKKEEHYLELNSDEKNLLASVKNRFSKTIVLLNTNNDFEMGFLDEFGISACLWIGGVGQGGLSGVGKILSGKTSPSGRLNDTLVYDDFSAPSRQNFGDFTYSNNTDYHYVSYKEGIYVGYRYYETRYADKVRNKGNPGDYDYSKTVAYPFGCGLSYTSFEYSSYDFHYDGEKDEYQFDVDVKNVGDTAGKDVIEIYFSAPFDHESSAIEKSAIELCGFEKTKCLNPGESEKISVRIDGRELASYDEKGKQSYILEKGDYYFALADNAHDAVNLVLKEKGYEVPSAKGFVSKKTLLQDDYASYSKDGATGHEITNLFDDASYDGMEVLSRKNWSRVSDLKDAGLAISEKNLEQSEKKGPEASLNPDWKKSVPPVTAKNGETIQLKDLTEASYDDPRWDTLVGELSKSELQKLFSTAGYHTIAIESIGKPEGKDTDGPAGLQSFVGGASSLKAYGYPTENVLACTYNKALAKEFGNRVGEDSLHCGVTGWYAPGRNTHRTPFGGRNFEYYSEDGFLAGKRAANVNLGCQEKGLYCFIKHFALNEQDTNRGTALHTYVSEQARREVYLVPFERAVKEGKATALRTSLNCIGVTAAVGNYNLITRLLKEEWGFKGFVITDYLGFDENLRMQTLFAGGDGRLSTYGLFSNKDDKTRAQLQRACKNILYTFSRSSGRYSLLSGNGKVSTGFAVYKIIFIAVDVLIVALLILRNLLFFVPKKKQV